MDDANKREALVRGIRGELGEAEALLSAMCEIEAIVRDRAMKRQQRSTNSDNDQELDSPRHRIRTPRMNRVTDDDDFFMFASVQREGDEARAKLEREKLEFVKMRIKKAKQDCNFEREEHCRERENAYKLELERPNLILQTFWKPEYFSECEERIFIAF